MVSSVLLRVWLQAEPYEHGLTKMLPYISCNNSQTGPVAWVHNDVLQEISACFRERFAFELSSLFCTTEVAGSMTSVITDGLAIQLDTVHYFW